MKATELLILLKEIQGRQAFLEGYKEGLSELEHGGDVSDMGYKIGCSKIFTPYVIDAIKRCAADCERFIKAQDIQIDTTDLKLIKNENKVPF